MPQRLSTRRIIDYRLMRTGFGNIKFLMHLIFPPQSNNHPVVRFLLVIMTRSDHQPMSSKYMSQIRAMEPNKWIIISNYLGKIRMMQAQIRPPGVFLPDPCINWGNRTDTVSYGSYEPEGVSQSFILLFVNRDR